MMRKILTLTLSLLVIAFTAHAQEIFNEDFSGYTGDINGQGGWVTSTNDGTFNVAGGEMELSHAAGRVMLSTSGTSLEVGESLQITLDHRLKVGGVRAHGSFFDSACRPMALKRLRPMKIRLTLGYSCLPWNPRSATPVS